MDHMTEQNDYVAQLDFSQQAWRAAATYRLSFVQREAENHRALEPELSNLLMTVRQCYEQEAWNLVMAFRDALQPFLDLQGYWPESLRVNEMACEAARAVGDAVSLARWTHDQADIVHQRGEYHRAEELYLAAEESYRELAEFEKAVESLHMRSLVVRAQGRWEDAYRLNQSTIDEARRLGMNQWLAHPLYVRGLLARDRGRFREARQAVENSLRLLVDDERAMIAQCRHFLGELALIESDRSEARFQLETSLDIIRESGVIRRVVATQRLLGDLERDEGNLEEAERIYQEALETATRLGDQPQLARLFLSRAQLMDLLGREQDREDLLQAALSTYEEVGDMRGVTTVSLVLSGFYLQKRRLRQAIRMVIKTVKVARSAGFLRPTMLLGAVRLRKMI